MLLALKIADFPMLKEDARKKLFAGLKKQAFPSILNSEAMPMTTERLADILRQKV